MQIIKRTSKHSPRKSTPLDRHIGNQVAAIRLAKGYSQKDLAAEIGVSFQQVQKYETGKNRLSIERLLLISEALDTELSFFIEGMGRGHRKPKPKAEYVIQAEFIELPVADAVARLFLNMPNSETRIRAVEVLSKVR